MSDMRLPLEDPRFLDAVAKLLGLAREYLGIVGNEIRYNGQPLTPDQHKILFAVMQMGAAEIQKKGGFKSPEAFKEITDKLEMDKPKR